MSASDNFSTDSMTLQTCSSPSCVVVSDDEDNESLRKSPLFQRTAEEKAKTSEPSLRLHVSPESGAATASYSSRFHFVSASRAVSKDTPVFLARRGSHYPAYCSSLAHRATVYTDTEREEERWVLGQARIFIGFSMELTTTDRRTSVSARPSISPFCPLIPAVTRRVTEHRAAAAEPRGWVREGGELM